MPRIVCGIREGLLIAGNEPERPRRTAHEQLERSHSKAFAIAIMEVAEALLSLAQGALIALNRGSNLSGVTGKVAQ